MSYINPALYSQDETAKDLLAHGEVLSHVQAQVDRAILKIVLSVGLSESDIAVDESGFVTSVFLEDYGVNYGLYRAFLSFAGSAAGEFQDIYGSKASYYREIYREARNQITKETITGADGAVPLPPGATVKTVTFVI